MHMLQRKNVEWVWEYDLCSSLVHGGECYGLNVMLERDEETRTLRCPRCGYTKSYREDWWNMLNVLRSAFYNRTPGKYFFKDLSAEEMVWKYLRELNHEDWCDWFDHDYGLARVKGDNETKEKLKTVAEILCEKMDYDPEPWIKAMEHIDEEEGYLIVPRIQWEKLYMELKEAGMEKTALEIAGPYEKGLYDLYRYNRSRGDAVACWVIWQLSRAWKMYADSNNFYDVDYDPYPVLFEMMLRGEWEERIYPLETAVVWQMDHAEHHLKWDFGADPEAAVNDALLALAIKLGWEVIYPPFHTFHEDEVEKIAGAVGDRELIDLYKVANKPPAEFLDDEYWKHLIDDMFKDETYTKVKPAPVNPEAVVAAEKFIEKAKSVIAVLPSPNRDRWD